MVRYVGDCAAWNEVVYAHMRVCVFQPETVIAALRYLGRCAILPLQYTLPMFFNIISILRGRDFNFRDAEYL